MAEYIIREQAKQAIYEYILQQTVSKYPSEELCKASRMGAEGAMYEIDYVPTADVVEVVRCKDCKYGEIDDVDFPDQYLCHHNGSDWNKGNHFCSYGERRDT